MFIGTSSLRIVVLILFLLWNALGCTKKESRSNTISLSFADKVSASNVSNIQTIIVNLQTSSGVEVREWDCDNENCNVVEFETDALGNALLQVLLVYEEGSDDTLILYAQDRRDLVGGNNLFVLPMTVLTSFESEAFIAGRYIPSPGHALAGRFLTGEMVMSVDIPNVPYGDVPDMKIMKREIFGGWFHSFALDSVGFKYTFRGWDQNGVFYDKVAIMNDLYAGGNGLRINSPGLQAQTTSRMHYFLNTPYFESDNGVFRPETFERKILGFFGANPGNLRLCSEALSPSTPLDGQNGRPFLCESLAAGSCSTYYSWGDIQKQGLITGAANTCSGNNNQMEIDLEDVVDDREDILGFYGPFIAAPNNGLDDFVEFDDVNSRIRWNISPTTYLPDGIEVLYKPVAASSFSSQPYEGRDGEVFCEKMLEEGFQSLGRFTANPGVFDLATSGIPNGSVVALCPVKPNNEGYYNSGIFVDPYEFGSPPSQPVSIGLFKAPHIDGFSGNMYSETCYPFIVELQDSNGDRFHSPIGLPISLNADANGSFFDHPSDCEANSGPITTISVGHFEILYFRHTNSSGNYTLQATYAGPLNDANFSYTALDVAGQSADELKIVPAFHRDHNILEMANTELCIPIIVAAFRDTGGGQKELIRGSSEAFNAIAPTTSMGISFGGLFQSESDCLASSAAFTSDTMTSTKSFHPIWMKVYEGGTPGSISSLLSGVTDTPLQYVEPGPYNHWHVDNITNGPTGEAGHCYKMKVGAYDNHKPNSYPTYFPNASTESIILEDIGATEGVFYPDGQECNNMSSSPMLYSSRSVSVNNTMTNVKFYYQPHLPGPMDVELDWGGDVRNFEDNVGIVTGGRTWIAIESTDGIFYDFLATMNPSIDSQTVVVTNVSGNAATSGAANVTGPHFSLNGGGPFGTPPGPICDSTFTPSEVCNMQLRFTPPVPATPPYTYEGVVEVQFNNGGMQYSRRVLRGVAL
jgi:hypothetical protein